MTTDEAGGTPETPRGDDRPRPQYGELAPPGWDWKPEKPIEPMTRAADHPSVRDATGVYRAEPEQRTNTPDAASGASGKTVARWDRPLALSMLIFSAFGVALAWGMLGNLTETLDMYHQQFELGPYVPIAAVGSILTAASIAQGILWATSVWFTIMRLRQKRYAAWIPVAAGAISVALLFVSYAIVISTDSVLMQSAEKLGF